MRLFAFFRKPSQAEKSFWPSSQAEEVFGFRALTEIIDFVSPVGNSSVPYPYAVDAEGRYYLVIEEMVLQRSAKTEDPFLG